MDKWIGQRLECLCKQQGMTQEALAAVVQRSQSWMSTVLKDKRDPGFHEVEEMLRAPLVRICDPDPYKLPPQVPVQVLACREFS